MPLAEIVVVGKGTVVGRYGALWVVYDGHANIYIDAVNMLIADPQPGEIGVLTYGYRGFSRMGCFRAADDPIVQ